MAASLRYARRTHSDAFSDTDEEDNDEYCDNFAASVVIYALHNHEFMIY